MSETTQATLAGGAAKETCEARAYAASSPSSGLAPATIRRRDLRPQDVQLDVLINEAYDRLAKGDVKYRFVVDMASLR